MATADSRDDLICALLNCQHAFRDHMKRRNPHQPAGSVGGMCMVAACPCLGFVVKPPETEPAPPCASASMWTIGLGSDDLHEIMVVANMLQPYGDNVNNVTVRARVLLEKLEKLAKARPA